MEILSHKPADRFRFLKELCREKSEAGQDAPWPARLYIYDESVGEILRLIVPDSGIAVILPQSGKRRPRCECSADTSSPQPESF